MLCVGRNPLVCLWEGYRQGTRESRLLPVLDNRVFDIFKEHELECDFWQEHNHVSQYDVTAQLWNISQPRFGVSCARDKFLDSNMLMMWKLASRIPTGHMSQSEVERNSCSATAAY